MILIQELKVVITRNNMCAEVDTSRLPPLCDPILKSLWQSKIETQTLVQGGFASFPHSGGKSVVMLLKESQIFGLQTKHAQRVADGCFTLVRIIHGWTLWSV